MSAGPEREKRGTLIRRLCARKRDAHLTTSSTGDVSGRKTALVFLVIAVAAFLLQQKIWSMAFYGIYQARDVLRAQSLLNGRMILFGPETTGGGFLPGGFYYFLIAVPLALGLGVKGVFFEMILLSSAAAALMGSFFYRTRGLVSAALAAALFLGNTVIVRAQSGFMNSSFLPIFAVSYVVAFLNIFTGRETEERRRNHYWLLCCVLFSLGIQVHFSSILLLIAALVVQALAPRLSLKRIETWGFVRGLLVIGLLLSPHLFWLLHQRSGQDLGQAVSPGKSWQFESLRAFDVFRVHARFGHPVLELVWGLLDVLNVYFLLFLLIGAGLTRLAALRRRPSGARGFLGNPANSILLIFGLVSIWACVPFVVRHEGARYAQVFACANVFLVVSFADWLVDGGGESREALLLLSLALAFGFLCSSDGDNRRFSLPLVALASGLAALSGLLYFEIERVKRFAFWCLVLLAALELRMSNIKSQMGRFASLARAEDALERLRGLYGWDGQRPGAAVFRLNVDHEFTLRGLPSPEPPNPGDRERRPSIDGIIVARASSPESASLEGKDPVQWLRANKLEPLLAAQLENRQILLLPPLDADVIKIFPYRYADRVFSGDLWQNIGIPYPTSNSPVFRDVPGAIFIGHFSNCSAFPALCDGRVSVEDVSPDRRSAYLRISIEGLSLSQPTPASSPHWTEAIRKPRLSLKCGDRIHDVDLISSLGFDYDEYLRGDTDNLRLAPFVHTYRNPCGGKPLREAVFSYEAVYAARPGKIDVLPGKSWKLEAVPRSTSGAPRTPLGEPRTPAERSGSRL
jgi:hypothetical protein